MTNPSILMPLLIAACVVLGRYIERAADRAFDKAGAMP